MTDTQPPETQPAPDLSRFDTDPDALAWAREHIQRYIDRATGFEAHCRETGNPQGETNWRTVRQFMTQTLIGGKGCVIAAFDQRLPEITGRLGNPSEVAW